MKNFTAQFDKMKTLAKSRRGYALLFAVLVSAVVLGVGVSILNIARKEILLTAGAAESQYAFYAADSGYECAVYQDLANLAFVGTTTAPNVNCGATYSGTPATPKIYSSPVKVAQLSAGVDTASYSYSFNVPISAAGSCADVTVTKYLTTTGSGTSSITTASTSILSDGFNVGWEASPGDCLAANPTKVERALLANY